ncbi:hypothetical protein O7635_25435 [Asanoa sp. WMMD1127]|uniref:hypothetical protein n=1 Tax=Asanoa sp. WMMD1127 TaxID=3016107 RepID=UPI0024176ACA|nr:hypothetical protein [Asanoa sp. WMMD1127]MDG4825203.1 hypothetical protein [Asanoa sp. WMMD1127]
MRALLRAAGRLQSSQLSVQALTRLCNVVVFLLASWVDTGNLALVAFQGALLAIPYTLIEALVGRPLSAGVVPATWSVEAWARRAATTVALPVGVIGYLSVWVALPTSSVADRLLVVAPVLLQLPLEALFWAMAHTRSRRRTNLVPQLTAFGTLAGAGLFAAIDLPLTAAALPAQLLVLAWALATRLPVAAGETRPSPWASVRIGAVYCVAAGVDLLYVVALPAAAGALAGQAAIVVLRAMDLAFGPFHVALSATTREDIVSSARGRFMSATRLLTVACLVAVAAVIVGSVDVRRLLADDLATLGRTAVILYCGYKAALMVSTWIATRHMIRARPGQYLFSALGSRVLAFGGLALATLWVSTAEDLFLLLFGCEVAVALWYAVRMRTARKEAPAGDPVAAGVTP